MFFDQPKTDTVYLELMLSIARVQRGLLDCHFDWRGRTPRPIPVKKGLFGRKRAAEPRYEQLRGQLESLRQQAQNHRRSMGYPSGTFWWNLPWEQVEAYLMYDLDEPELDGSWRFERQWKCAPTDGGSMLMLREEGHCSRFDSTTTFDSQRVSAYSDSEIDSRMRRLDDRMNAYDLETLATYKGRVHSLDTGIDYDSAAEYVYSAENWLHKERQRERLARSLYTMHETTTTYAVSQSVHYDCLFAVAEYHVRADGTLDHLGILNYKLCSFRGSAPEDIALRYSEKDAAVACAAYLADSTAPTRVPMKLFGRDLMEGAATYSEAIRLAEVYTCLADKIDIRE